MYLLDALDYRTLLACESLLAIVFAVVFLGMHRVFPEVRGVRSVALGFLLVLPDTLFVAFNGKLSTVVTVLMANTLMLGSLIAMYEGIVAFTGGRSHRWMLWLSAFVTFAVGYFYTEVKHNILPCLIMMTLAMALIRGVTALTLLRRSLRPHNRLALIGFGLFVGALAIQGIYHAWSTFVHRSVQDASQQHAVQAGLLVSGVFYLSVSGLCFLVLTSKEMVARRRLEILRDPESGTYNRHGLEANLALELERFHFDGKRLSIALFAVNDLESIRTSGGRGAANAAVREIAETMATQLRRSDHLGRFGPDQFLLIFAGTGHAEAAIGVERIAGHVGKLNFLSGVRSPTLSIGITQAGQGDDVAALLARAEAAVEQARKDGRNFMRTVLPRPCETTGEAISAVA